MKYFCFYLFDLFDYTVKQLTSAFRLIFCVVFKKIEIQCLLCEAT